MTTQPRPAPGGPARPQEWERLVAEALRSERLPLPDLSALRPGPDEVRATETPLSARLQPAGVVVDELRPQFAWSARPRSTYLVTVFHDGRQVAASEPLRQPRWRPSQDLVAGRTAVT
jgi:hypothetical protein